MSRKVHSLHTTGWKRGSSTSEAELPSTSLTFLENGSRRLPNWYNGSFAPEIEAQLLKHQEHKSAHLAKALATNFVGQAGENSQFLPGMQQVPRQSSPQPAFSNSWFMDITVGTLLMVSILTGLGRSATARFQLGVRCSRKELSQLHTGVRTPEAPARSLPSHSFLLQRLRSVREHLRGS